MRYYLVRLVLFLMLLYWKCPWCGLAASVPAAVFSTVAIEILHWGPLKRVPLRGQTRSIPTPLLFVFLSSDCLGEHGLANSGYLSDNALQFRPMDHRPSIGCSGKLNRAWCYQPFKRDGDECVQLPLRLVFPHCCECRYLIASLMVGSL